MPKKRDKKKTIQDLQAATSVHASFVSDVNHAIDSTVSVYGGLESLKESNNDPMIFLMDIIMSVFGNQMLEKAIDKIFKKAFRSDVAHESSGKNFNDTIKDAILEGLKVNDDNQMLPSGFLGAGYKLPVKMIDLFDLYKVNPTTQIGQVLYGTHASNFNFAFQAQVLQMAGSGFEMVPAVSGISFNYSQSTNLVTVKGDTSVSAMTVNEFFTSILANPAYPLIDKNKIMVDIIDSIYNTLSKNKSVTSLENEELIKNAVEALGQTKEMDKVYDFNPQTMLEQVQQNSLNRKKGVYTIDFGCSSDSITITETDVINVLTSESFTVGVTSLLGENSPQATGNEAVANNISRNIVKNIIFIILKNTLFSPRIMLLIALSSIFKTGWTDSIYAELANAITAMVTANESSSKLHSATNDFVQNNVVKSNNKIIQLITTFVTNLILDFLLDIVIKEIVKLVAPVNMAKAKELLQSYQDLLDSILKATTRVANAL